MNLFTFVLNASRHHGERDLASKHQAWGAVGCSTPLGITASGTQTGCLAELAHEAVLNASRHHGERDRQGRR